MRFPVILLTILFIIVSLSLSVSCSDAPSYKDTPVLSVLRTDDPNKLTVRLEAPGGCTQVFMTPEEVEVLGGTIPEGDYWQKYVGTDLYGGVEKKLTNSPGVSPVAVIVVSSILVVGLACLTIMWSLSRLRGR